jgi:hypothetical protein
MAFLLKPPHVLGYFSDRRIMGDEHNCQGHHSPIRDSGLRNEVYRSLTMNFAKIMHDA